MKKLATSTATFLSAFFLGVCYNVSRNKVRCGGDFNA